MHTVIKDFTDLKDGNHIYRTGDIFPREGMEEISEDRIVELSTTKNKRGEVLIKKIESSEPPNEQKENNKIDLETLKVDELKTLCDERDMKYLARATKGELIKLLEEGE